MSGAYQVIARKWRPQQFSEVVGQDHIVRTLRNAIESGRIAHAYLFVGPRGTGKTTTARIFAKALNCENGPTATPCGVCANCQAINAGTSMDVMEIDGASNNSVDQIRDLRDDVRYAPTQGRFKIYIIDEVHMLSTQAFNALLKTLEEPPSHVKFVFATTESQKVLPTIVSRCQRFELKPISEERIAERLELICREEKIDAAPEALLAVARLAQGGMRDAQSILDQMIAFCGEKISEQDVLDVYGLAGRKRIEELASIIAAGDAAGVLEAVDAMASEGRDLFRVLQDLQSVVREVLLDSIRAGGESARLGRSMTTESLVRLLEVLRDGEASVKSGLSEKINLEVVLLKALEQSRARSIDTLIREIAEISESLPEEAGSEKKKVLSRPVAEPRIPNPVAEQIPDAKPANEVSESGENGERNADSPVAEAPGNYDEEQWKSSFDEADSAVTDAVSEEAADDFEEEDRGPLPSLEEMLAKIPARNQELLEGLFRGRFVAVQRLDRKKLF